MKNKKQQLKSVLSTLALALALAGNLALPDASLEDPNSILPQIPVEDEVPERDEEDGVRPLTDIDEPITRFDTTDI